MVLKSGITKVQAIIIVVLIVIIAIVGVWSYFAWFSGAPKDTIILGASCSLTGVHREAGAWMQAVWNYVIEEWNKKDGIYVKDLGRKLKVELKYVLDDKSDSTTCTNNIETLCSVYDVDFVLCSSMATEATMKVVERYNKIMVIGCHGPFFAFAKEKGYKYTFAFGVTPYGFLEGMISFFRDNPHLNPPPKVLAIWHIDEETRNAAVEWIKGRSGRLTIINEKFPSEVTDFSTAIIKAKEVSPPIDVLILWLGDWSQVVTCFRQLQEYNWCPKAVGSLYNTAPSIMTETLGPACYYRFYTPQPSENPELLAFYETVMERYNLATLQVGIPFNTWGGITTLFNAIERAGTLNSLKVAEAYRQLLQEGVYVFGISYTWDPNYPNFYQELPAVAVQVPPYEKEGSTLYFKLVKSGDQWFPENWKWPMPPWGE